MKEAGASFDGIPVRGGRTEPGKAKGQWTPRWSPSGFLPDANVVSEFDRRRGPDPLVRQWLEAADGGSPCASVPTVAGIRFGVEMPAPGKRRAQ